MAVHPYRATIAGVETYRDARLARLSRRRVYGVAKRAFDLVVSATALVILIPVFLLVMIAIAVDSSGPVMFGQERIGRHGKPFRIYKFRTMAHTTDDGLVWLEDERGTRRHKVRNDPRVTRVGRWLRRTSIDELPQLFNILRGDMSVVGPRPELPGIVATYEPWQHERHAVRPGLTGWWQVSGRGDRPMHENTELDIYYIERQSFWLDLVILVKTVGVVFRGLGAF